MRPGAPPKPSKYVYTGPGEVSSLITDPHGTSVIPCFNKIQYIKVSRQQSFTSIQTFHTHTPCLRQGGLLANEVKVRMKMGMKMKWKWKRNERLLSRDTRTGTQKKRERANTHTNTPGPERANPERARDRKSGGRRTRKRQAEGGEDGSAWTNLPQRNLHLPKHAQNPTYL